jgi:hypothetical protein
MTDKRYNIAREYCGHDTPRWVARFCGEWVGQHKTQQGARDIAIEHATERKTAA